MVFLNGEFGPTKFELAATIMGFQKPPNPIQLQKIYKVLANAIDMSIF
jgi:hypothetical protein